LGRSTSVIPAVPAAWSVTTIAFIARLLVSSSSPLLHGADPRLVPGRVIGKKWIDHDLGRARLDAAQRQGVSK
jgi:hypothetical protein